MTPHDGWTLQAVSRGRRWKAWNTNPMLVLRMANRRLSDMAETSRPSRT